MKKIRAAVVGYGNIGKFTLEALEAAPDFEVAGIVRRNGAENKPAELADYPVVKDIREQRSSYHFCRMGSGKRLCSTCAAGSHRSERNHLH